MRRSILCSIVLLVTLPALFAQDQTSRPRITGIAEVDLYSTNVEAAANFYTTIFDSENSSAGGCVWSDVSQVANGAEANFHGFCSGQNLRLSKPPGMLPDTFLREIAFAVDDVKATKKYLEAKRIAIEKNSSEQYFAVTDPEGHRIGFFQSSPSAAPSSGHMRIIHAGFVVKDRASMDDFYKDILGFRPYWHGGMKDSDTDWVAMQVPDGTDWIEFMLNVPPDADKQTLGVMNHVSIGVKDIKVAAASLEKSRANMRADASPKIGRDGKWQFNLYDPDETRVELMEFTPVEKPCCSEFTAPHPKP